MLKPGPGKEVWHQMRVRWAFAVTLVGMTAQVGGCAETLPFAQLPDFYKLPDKVLTKDEQQGKVNQMIQKGQSHEAEAAKEIEKGK
jgi:hypothetical protein